MTQIPQTLLQSIATLDESALRSLNKSVCTLIKARMSVKSQAAIGQLMPGMRVQWKNKFGSVTRGTVEKVNFKNVIVKTDAGTRWNVAATFLRAE